MIRLHPKFQPLVTSEARYKIITGGRGSGKSYSTATLILLESDKDDGTILYTRFTLKNAEQSIFPEFEEKIDQLGWRNKFHKSGNDYINLESGGRILFRGIKTSDGINTAALKSIPKLKMWVNDESEELVDENIFNTIDLSIRDAKYKLQIWLILNPSDVNHFIYRKFFKNNGIFDVYNGTKDNVTYIHTTFLENPHISPTFLQLAERCKAEDAAKYDNLYLGKWRTLSEGNIYHGWEEIADADYPTHLSCWYGVDWGFSNDPMAIVRACYDSDTHTIYLKELCYEKGKLTSFAADTIRKDILNRRTLLYEGEGWSIYHHNGKCWIGEQCYTDSEVMENDAVIADANERQITRGRLGQLLKMVEPVYCDPARPEQIYELRTLHSIYGLPATNTDKVGRIEYLKYFNIKFVGGNMRQEYEGYKWQTAKNDTAVFINKPMDGNDHCFTANTLISTQRGNIPIVDVKVGDKVLTSQGYKNVLMQWDNGEKLVYEYTLEFEGKHIVVTATPEHKIKTTKGWKELRQLKEGDVLFLQQSSMEELTTSTKGQGISHSTIRNSIERFGSFTMGIFRKAFTYTIWMVIALITPLITLFAYLRKTISSCTKKVGEKGLNQKSKFSISKLFRRKPSCGTKAKKVESGTSSMRDRLSLNNIIAFVSCVVRSMSQKRKALYIAVMRIMQKQGVLMETIIYKWIARFVEQPLSQTDIEAQKLVANKSVLKSVSAELKGQRRVYDLTVEEIHEYYANGVLVHNCLDAANYGCVTHLRRMRVANKIGEN